MPGPIFQPNFHFTACFSSLNLSFDIRNMCFPLIVRNKCIARAVYRQYLLALETPFRRGCLKDMLQARWIEWRRKVQCHADSTSAEVNWERLPWEANDGYGDVDTWFLPSARFLARAGRMNLFAKASR